MVCTEICGRYTIFVLQSCKKYALITICTFLIKVLFEKLNRDKKLGFQ